MTHASSEEEIKAMRSDFGLRLSSSMAQYGPLCVGIDAQENLTDWGYNVDAEGAELFSMRMLQAMRDRAAAVKFQEPMFERYGSKGFAAARTECSTPLVKWASSPSWTASMEPVHHHLRHRGRILQAGRPSAGRRHHPAAVLWRTLTAGPHQ